MAGRGNSLKFDKQLQHQIIFKIVAFPDQIMNDVDVEDMLSTLSRKRIDATIFSGVTYLEIKFDIILDSRHFQVLTRSLPAFGCVAEV